MEADSENVRGVVFDVVVIYPAANQRQAPENNAGDSCRFGEPNLSTAHKSGDAQPQGCDDGN